MFVHEPEFALPDAADIARLQILNDEASDLAHNGEPKRALQAAREALETAQRLRRPDQEMRALNSAAMCHFNRGDHIAGLACGLDAHQIAVRLGDAAGYGRALMGIAGAAYSLRSFEDAEQGFRHSLRIGIEIGDEELQVRAMNALGIVLADLGEFEAGEAMLRDAWERLEPFGQNVQMVRVVANLATVCKKHGVHWADLDRRVSAQHLESAAILAERALGMIRTLHSKYDLAGKAALLGEIRLLQGEFEPAARYLRQAVEWAQEIRNHLLLARANIANARLHLAQDRPSDAFALCGRALDEARLAQRDDMQIECYDVMIEALQRLGRRDEAVAAAAAAAAAGQQFDDQRERHRRDMHHVLRNLAPLRAVEAMARA